MQTNKLKQRILLHLQIDGEFMNIKDKTAIITGGASGLGEACARQLVAKGANVAIFDIEMDKGEALATDLGSKAISIKADVTSEESIQEGISRTIDAFGAVHIVVNCAGAGPPMKVLSKNGPFPLDQFSRVIQLNLVGTFNVIRLGVEQMVKNEPDESGDKGVIINTASVAAFDGQIGQAAYSASKAGIVGMTLPIARECAAYGIRMMTIAPGIFDTPLLAELPEHVLEALGQMVPFPSRLGMPAEFASLTCHIVENAYLNGEVVRLDGAFRMAAK